MRPIAVTRLRAQGRERRPGSRRRAAAVRHGLTAETVIGALEDAEDYQAFEAAIIADYDAQSGVERELVLRLASVLWRLRRATTMETGLFEIQSGHLAERQQSRKMLTGSQEVIHAVFRRSTEVETGASRNIGNTMNAMPEFWTKAGAPNVEFARCFLRLADLPNFALDRLSRYETNLWRQAGRILYALEMLDRRKPQERMKRFSRGYREPQVDSQPPTNNVSAILE